MINRDTIAMMRDSAILVNTSRGGLIDTDALIEALRARKFGGVGLDVYEDEDDQVFQDFSDDVLENEVVPVLLSFPNVVITSHQAFFTRTALQSIAAITLENARAFARGEELKNEVKAIKLSFVCKWDTLAAIAQTKFFKKYCQMHFSVLI